MNTIGDILKRDTIPRFEQVKKARGGITSERAEHIENLIIMLGENKNRFGYWLGRTKHLSGRNLYMLMQRARGGRNPAALLNYLLKKTS